MHTALISGDPHSTYTHNVLSSGNLSKVPRAGSFDPVANNAAVLGTREEMISLTTMPEYNFHHFYYTWMDY